MELEWWVTTPLPNVAVILTATITIVILIVWFPAILTIPVATIVTVTECDITPFTIEVAITVACLAYKVFTIGTRTVGILNVVYF